MPFSGVADKYSRDVLCFYVADKWFCFVNIEVFDFCCLKCQPEESGELQAGYIGIKPGWQILRNRSPKPKQKRTGKADLR